MRRKKVILFFISIFLFLTTIVPAQDIPFSERFFPTQTDSLKLALIDLQNGDDYFLSGKTAIYKYAIPHFESASKFNNSNASLNYKLGTCYLMARKKDLALAYLKKAIELNPEVEPDAYYYLGRTYQMLFKWDEAIAQYFQYGELIKGKEPVDNVSRRIEECRNGKVLSEKPIQVKIENLGVAINTRGHEYTPLITADESQLFFTSRRLGNTGNEQDYEDLDYFEDIYVSEKVNDRWTTAKNLGPKVNTPEHDAGAGLSLDGHILFVFKGNRNNGDILMSYKDKGEWTNPIDPGKNINTKYHESSACFSPDGNTLYFSSDRPGGYGNRDLFMSQWDASKKIWGPAINMGGTINTQYDEEGVYMHPSGTTLYFSSKGHNSIGGYDVFYSVFLNGSWQKPVNVGFPVNTADDDVYFVVPANGEHAYYTSANDDTYGETDLYKITFLSATDKPISKMMVLKGIITGMSNGQPVEATIELFDLNNQERIGTFNSDSKTGKYLVSLPAGKKYGIFVYANGYLFESDYFEVLDSATFSERTYDIKLKSVESGNNIVLSNIFFDTGKSELKDDSQETLKNLARIMNDYPTLTVEIAGHTDNDGNAEFNNKLSEDRAKSVADYLVANSISKTRVTYKGYGSSQPLCPNDSPENKMRNRRIEFRIQ